MLWSRVDSGRTMIAMGETLLGEYGARASLATTEQGSTLTIGTELPTSIYRFFCLILVRINAGNSRQKAIPNLCCQHNAHGVGINTIPTILGNDRRHYLQDYVNKFLATRHWQTYVERHRQDRGNTLLDIKGYLSGRQYDQIFM